MLDIQWFKPNDICNSFTNFNLYGRDNILSNFSYMGTWTDYSLSNLNIKLKNEKSWEFYIVYSKTCNGTDSVLSDTISIDNIAPVRPELDSVSVDLATQQIIMGWQYNISQDTKGYRGYIERGLTNQRIFDTSLNVYKNPDNSNSSLSPYSFSIAAFDTCGNLSLISDAHTTIFLESQYDKCLKTIQLRWSPYKGWKTEGYDIYLKINSGNYQKIGNVISLINQFTYNFQNFGDTYCFFVRAKKDSSNITSSSNRVCTITDGVIATKNSYIAKVSVNNKEVEMTLSTNLGTSLEQIHILKSTNNGGFLSWMSMPFTGGEIDLIDNNVNTDNNTYQYLFYTEGPCNLFFDTSQVAGTILLKTIMQSPGSQSLSWNEYSQFIKSTDKQEILLGNSPNLNKSSTWNILSTENNGIRNYEDNSDFGINQEQLCYCVRAIENIPSVLYPRIDSSYSNIVCLTADPIVFFPNAIQINGFNNVFKPVGTYLDTLQSSFEIFNRWGEVIFTSTRIETGWDGRSSDGEFVQSDVYGYRAKIIGINGKMLFFNGTITVLK